MEAFEVETSLAATGTLAGTGSEAAGLDVSALQPASKTANRRQRENLFIRDNPVGNVKTGLIIWRGRVGVKQLLQIIILLLVYTLQNSATCLAGLLSVGRLQLLRRLALGAGNLPVRPPTVRFDLRTPIYRQIPPD